MISNGRDIRYSEAGVNLIRTLGPQCLESSTPEPAVVDLCQKLIAEPRTTVDERALAKMALGIGERARQVDPNVVSKLQLCVPLGMIHGTIHGPLAKVIAWAGLAGSDALAPNLALNRANAASALEALASHEDLPADQRALAQIGLELERAPGIADADAVKIEHVLLGDISERAQAAPVNTTVSSFATSVLSMPSVDWSAKRAILHGTLDALQSTYPGADENVRPFVESVKKLADDCTRPSSRFAVAQCAIDVLKHGLANDPSRLREAFQLMHGSALADNAPGDRNLIRQAAHGVLASHYGDISEIFPDHPAGASQTGAATGAGPAHLILADTPQAVLQTMLGAARRGDVELFRQCIHPEGSLARDLASDETARALMQDFAHGDVELGSTGRGPADLKMFSYTVMPRAGQVAQKTPYPINPLAVFDGEEMIAVPQSKLPDNPTREQIGEWLRNAKFELSEPLEPCLTFQRDGTQWKVADCIGIQGLHAWRPELRTPELTVESMVKAAREGDLEAFRSCILDETPWKHSDNARLLMETVARHGLQVKYLDGQKHNGDLFYLMKALATIDEPGAEFRRTPQGYQLMGLLRRERKQDGTHRAWIGLGDDLRPPAPKAAAPPTVARSQATAPRPPASRVQSVALTPLPASPRPQSSPGPTGAGGPLSFFRNWIDRQHPLTGTLLREAGNVLPLLGGIVAGPVGVGVGAVASVAYGWAASGRILNPAITTAVMSLVGLAVPPGANEVITALNAAGCVGAVGILAVAKAHLNCLTQPAAQAC